MTIKALYPTVRPTLNLDFAKTKALDPRITFTRASTATFVGSNGLIQTAASGAPRFDHNPTTGESLGLLVEEARTNAALYSDLSSNNVIIDATQGLNAATSPDGLFTASLITATSISNNFYQATSVTSGSAYSYSIFVKAGTASYVEFSIFAQIGFTNTRLTFGTGQISGEQSANLSVTAYPGGWFRVTWGFVSNATSIRGLNLRTADGTSYYAWGRQNEAGSFPTSYIPTVASTVTRAVDGADMTGTNFSSWYRQDEGSLFGQYVLRGGNQGILWIWDGHGAALNYWFIGPTANAGGVLGLNTRSNQGTTLSLGHRGRIDNATNLGYVVKHAAAIAANDFACYTRSGSGDFDNNTGSPALASGEYLPPLVDRLILAESSGPFLLNASITIARLSYYPVRLPDAQLQALTAT